MRQAGEMAIKVLVVEDDDAVRLLLRLLLEDEGYQVIEASDGRRAVDRFALEPAQLVLLDVRLPELNGFDVCRTLRATTDAPIVMLTAQDDSHDVVAGLEAGADDYVTKPFVDKELLARIRAQLRRSTRGTKGDPSIVIDDLEIRPAEGAVLKRGAPVNLTRTEYHLLRYLADNANILLTRERLLEQVWGYDHSGDGRLVDAHIRRLRTKVETEPARPQIVQTVRGLGYKLVRP